MDCGEIFEGLSEYLDDDLPEEICREIRRHLDDCHNCQVVVNTLKRTVYLYHTFPREEIPGETRKRLHKIIRMETEAESG
ncbi:MAG: zf-HC2 domain-containing protein [Thermoleophilia bacterium]|nr:zf-HC2 domain-containing protein [Thermoleophilia bacterium]